MSIQLMNTLMKHSPLLQISSVYRVFGKTPFITLQPGTLSLKFTVCFILFCLMAKAQYFEKTSNTQLTKTPGDSRSVNWVDVNNDGWIDCFISNGPSGGQNNNLYINNGNGDFNLLQNDSIVLDKSPSDGATFGDIDNDGDLDAFVVNWYNVNNLFYLNKGNGQFTKINSEIISNDKGYSETASWGDYDQDGLLDLYVSNSETPKKNFLYHNEGSGKFKKITTGPATTDAYYSRSVNWTDIDNDGDVDLFVSNENNEAENCYRNDGGGNFTKLSNGPLLTDGGNTMSSSWADFDNDGDLDVFLANDKGKNALFRNEGNFIFTKLTSDTTAKIPSNSFSSAWSDIDNDGDLDLFVTNAFATNSLLKNFLFLNKGDGTFSRNTTDTCVNELAWSYGCAFGDYNNDGFEDLAVATCRFGGVDKTDLLYKNKGNTNNWLTLQLTGTISNKSAIGTKVYLKSVINGKTVWQMRETSAQSGHCSQNDLRVHFGLGDAPLADSLIILWPSGIKEVYTGIPVKQFLSLTEGMSNTIAETNLAKELLLVFPNPTTSLLQISRNHSPLKKGEIIYLYDLKGTLIYEYTIPSDISTATVNLAETGIHAGTYLVYLCQNRHCLMNKVIIK